MVSVNELAPTQMPTYLFTSAFRMHYTHSQQIKMPTDIHNICM